MPPAQEAQKNPPTNISSEAAAGESTLGKAHPCMLEKMFPLEDNSSG